MKTFSLFTPIFALTVTSSFAKSPCEKNAIAIVKHSLERTESAKSIKKYAQYKTESLGVKGSEENGFHETILVTASNLYSEKSDAFKVYKIVYDLTAVSQSCSVLKSMRLVDERFYRE